MSTPSGPPRSRFVFGVIVVCLLIMTIPFAPYIGFFAHVWWNEYTEPTTAPHPRIIHTHGPVSETVIAPIAQSDTAPSTTEAGAPVPFGRDEARMLEWQKANEESWFEMDPGLRVCVRARYLKPDPVWAALGGNYTVENAIDECLAYAERNASGLIAQEDSE